MSEQAKLLAKKEAGKLLSVSAQTVGRWIASGALSSVKVGRTRKVYRDEVMELLDLKERELVPRRLDDEVTFLKYKMIKMERTQQEILQVLELTRKHEIFSDTELVYWYREAKKIGYAQTVRFKDAKFERWHGVLSNLHEEELKRLKSLTGDPTPWVPFMKLCARITSIAKYNRGKRKLPTTTSCSEWMNIFMLLRTQIRNRATAMTWEEPYDYDAGKRVDVSLSQGNPAPVELRAKKKEWGG